ncbi:MAG: hypothetical protein HN736_12455 [Anaerolineae bacterium]|jgi:hypothetical protein|nr:hypothetical protein [Anaerolineae bacterium]MBT3712032.1 hypothetical protein [Anaerolineae bacterium]MBT4312034.1 hypothetical protein [Anaerolineae bacterium]MBT4459259.1 hypothetical protein [Anaerolineae bacterium]MBT4842011.1 hypothetical protein [Anaerolineae bacterium]
MSNPNLSIQLNPKKILKILLGITLALVVLNIVALYLRFFPERYQIYNQFHEFIVDLIVNQFALNTEMNFPTYFSSIQLLLASILFFLIAAWKKLEGDKYRIHWKGLGFLLLLFSIDEFTVMHERLSKLFKNLPDFYGLFSFKWVFAGIGFVVIFGLLYLMFFFQLEKKYKILFLASAALFFIGALGFEIISGRYANYNDTRNITYNMITTVEETLEMGGISLLVYSLFDYIKTHFPETRFFLNTEESK